MELETLCIITNAEKLVVVCFFHEGVIMTLEISGFHKDFQELCSSHLLEQKALMKLELSI